MNKVYAYKCVCKVRECGRAACGSEALRMYIKIDAINGTRPSRARLVYERSIETMILLE